MNPNTPSPSRTTDGKRKPIDPLITKPFVDDGDELVWWVVTRDTPEKDNTIASVKAVAISVTPTVLNVNMVIASREPNGQNSATASRE